MKEETFLLVLAVILSSPKAAGQGLEAEHSTTAKTKNVATVEGPDAADVISTISGFLVTAKPSGEITALSMPSLRETVVRPADTGNDRATIHALSGPDTAGWIAYIEDHLFVPNEKDEKHLLKLVRLDGMDEQVIFSRTGSAIRTKTSGGGGAIGTYLALSPSRKRLAFVTNLVNVQLPQALLSVGKLEIWDVAGKGPLALEAEAMDKPLSWFPDGNRLAYVRLVRRDKLPISALGLDRFGEYFGERWDEIPSIYILDTETGKSEFLHVGWVPVVSCDGKSVLVGGWDNRSAFSWNRLRVDTRDTMEVTWPEDAGGALAVTKKGVVLYWGAPTSGLPVKYAEGHEGTEPIPMLALKAALINSNRFQTIVEVPRGLASFGCVARK